MSFDPTAARLAVRLSRTEVTSARPDAPVVPPAGPRAPLSRLRVRLATDLHAVARWVEPAEPRRRSTTGACQPG